MGNHPNHSIQPGVAPVAKHHAFIATVNRQPVYLTDKTPTVRQILAAADKDPADDHVLIELLHKQTRALSLDEVVKLTEDLPKHFMAFLTDRVYRFTMAGNGYEWGQAAIEEDVLREIGDVDDDHVIVVDDEDGDQELAPGSLLQLGAPGTEHLRVVKKYVVVCIDNENRQIRRGK